MRKKVIHDNREVQMKSWGTYGKGRLFFSFLLLCDEKFIVMTFRDAEVPLRCCKGPMK